LRAQEQPAARPTRGWEEDEYGGGEGGEGADEGEEYDDEAGDGGDQPRAGAAQPQHARYDDGTSRPPPVDDDR
jgi:hypothetical protein